MGNCNQFYVISFCCFLCLYGGKNSASLETNETFSSVHIEEQRMPRVYLFGRWFNQSTIDAANQLLQSTLTASNKTAITTVKQHFGVDTTKNSLSLRLDVDDEQPAVLVSSSLMAHRAKQNKQATNFSDEVIPTNDDTEEAHTLQKHQLLRRLSQARRLGEKNRSPKTVAPPTFSPEAFSAFLQQKAMPARQHLALAALANSLHRNTGSAHSMPTVAAASLSPQIGGSLVYGQQTEQPAYSTAPQTTDVMEYIPASEGVTSYGDSESSRHQHSYSKQQRKQPIITERDDGGDLQKKLLTTGLSTMLLRESNNLITTTGLTLKGLHKDEDNPLEHLVMFVVAPLLGLFFSKLPTQG